VRLLATLELLFISFRASAIVNPAGEWHEELHNNIAVVNVRAAAIVSGKPSELVARNLHRVVVF